MSAKRFFISIVFVTSTLYSPLSTPTSNAFTITDDTGQALEITSPPTRIVSLAPGLTEILYFLGLGDRIVGVTDYCDFPPPALAKPKVGGLHADIETILTLQPDLVIGGTGLYQEQNIARFKRFHIPYFLVDPSSTDKVFEIIRRLGVIAGVEETSEEKIIELRRRLEHVRRRVSAEPKPRLLYVVGKEPLISVGGGSFINDLIRDAGGVNIAGDLSKDYPLLTMEYVIRRDPQVIILAADADRNLADVDTPYWDRWSSLSAVRDGRIFKVHGNWLNRPGPRMIEGVEELAGLLHPTLDLGRP